MAKVELEIKNCNECPFLEKVSAPTKDNFERPNDWHCKKSGGKKIEGHVNWNEEKNVSIPIWCEILVNKNPREEVEHTLVHSRDIVAEDDSVCIEFSVLEDEDGEFSMPSFDVTNKKTGESSFWDNDDWIVRYYKGEQEALSELSHVSVGTVSMFEQMLKAAVDKGYIKIES